MATAKDDTSAPVLSYASPVKRRPWRWPQWIDLGVGVVTLGIALLVVATVPIGLADDISWTMAPLLPWMAAVGGIVVAHYSGSES